MLGANSSARTEDLASKSPPDSETKTSTVPLFTASAAALFVELVLIRWIPSVVHVVGFFANVVLIASFLGLGVGMMGARHNPGQAAIYRLATLVGVLTVYRLVDPSVQLAANTSYGINEVVFTDRVSLPLPLILIGVFSLVAWALIPFGRLIAAHFDQHERIRAYTTNIGGSLVGVGAFTIVSAFGWPSIIWFLGLVAFVALHAPARSVLIGGVSLFIALGAVYYVDSNQFQSMVLWSPYNQLRVHAVGAEIDDGFVIEVNNQFLLSGLDLGTPVVVDDRSDTPTTGDVDWRTYYDFPFELANPGRVLVLGAGAGNDLAAALRADVDHVTAVEIDPRIAQFGADHHPEQPHLSDRVELVVDDARSFLKSTDQRYDLVLFATLDAHGLISSSSSVRLDSFVYTQESLEEAKALLDDGGLLILSFGPFREEVQLRQYAMMEMVFGSPPAYFIHDNNHRVLVAGSEPVQVSQLPPGWRAIDRAEVLAGFERFPSALLPATDDWPHLYIRDRGIPSEYVITLVGMALVGLVLIGLVLVRSETRSVHASDLPFFFLGAAFLLMETKSVTEFALLIGSTWQTNALVFAVILMIILLANLFVQRRVSVHHRGWLLVVGGSLIAHYLWPISVWPDFGDLKLVAASVYLGAPMFAAAVVFARWFSASLVGSVALGVNLLGAVVGGTLEYGSLIVGIRALALVAIALYALAYVSYEVGARRLVAGEY